MSIDILNMRRFEENAHAIDVALPVLAVECEATPPLENYLDAYEEAVLRLVALGLSTHGIANTLHATESLIEEILSHLEEKQYAYREIGKPWKLTADGEKYQNGEVEERASKESQYGYMFVNAIKKEVLPFFYQGDVGQISLFRGKPLPLKLTLGGDEEETFSPIQIKQAKLKKAYKAYFRNQRTIAGFDEDEIAREEAEDLFSNVEAFDEGFEDELEASAGHQTGELSGNMFIRELNKERKKLYLRMRMVIDSQAPGGYRAESPFPLNGLDDRFFLRQIQWLEQSGSAYLADKALSDFLQKEIHKISPSLKPVEEDFSVFLLKRMPLLKSCRTKVPYVYDDLERIYYSLMPNHSSLVEQENIVNNLARRVLEGLFNAYFRSIGSSELKRVQEKVFKNIDDINSYGDERDYRDYKKRICRTAGLQEDTLRKVDPKYLKGIVDRLSRSYGNSIREKLINMLVLEYYLGDAQIHRFFSQNNLNQTYRLIGKLNHIRNKVSHDTDEKFEYSDYDFYMANVFVLANYLLEGLRED